MGTSQSQFVSLDTVVPKAPSLCFINIVIIYIPCWSSYQIIWHFTSTICRWNPVVVSISPTIPTGTVHLVEQRLTQLHYWFCVNGLLLNPVKSEARQRSLSLPPVPSVNIAGSTIPISATIKTLGVILTFNQHISPVCKSSYFHLCALHHLHSMLTEDMAKSVTIALVSSHLDYVTQFIWYINW